MSEKIYQFNEYILSYDKGENDRSCLIISKCLLDKIYIMAELYDGSAELISTILDSLQQQVKKQKEAIDKAIEYSDKHWGHWCSNHCKYMTELQDILKEVSE